MNYRKGLLRTFFVVAACWAAGIVSHELYVTTAIPLTFYPESQITKWASFWDVPTEEECEKFILHNDKGIAELPPDRQVVVLRKIWGLVGPYRQRKIFRIAALAVVPPSLLYLLAFMAVPWIKSGFSQ